MLGGGRYLYRQFDPIPKVFTSRPSVRHCKVAAAKQSNEEIVKPPEKNVVIPPRIERGPTDILRVLSSTVGYDPTAFHYKFIDDPFLYPISNYQKKIYGLALESGRKSAKWVLERHSELFERRVSDPPAEFFLPKRHLKENSSSTEDDLIYAIEDRDVARAIELYRNLKGKNCEVSNSTKQCLLELVCFYNCEPVPEENPETKWLGLEETNPGTWKKGGFAEELFSEMDPNCPMANSALIQGMLKFQEVEEASKLFEKALKANMNLNTEVYNLYLEKQFLDVSDKPLLHKKILQHMAENGVKPNLGTLNSILIMLNKLKYFPAALAVAEEAMEEFTALGIKPSLGTYGLLIRLCGHRLKMFGEKESPEASNYIAKILDQIENVEHQLQHRADLKFFLFAMFAAVQKLEDVDLAMRIERMYFKNNNARFITKYEHQHLVFRNLCTLTFKKKPMEFSMELLRRYVFTTIDLDVELVSHVLQAVDVNYAPQYIPELWNMSVAAGLIKNRVVLARFLKLVNTFSDEETSAVMREAALLALEKLEEVNLIFNEEDTFSNILVAFVKAKDEKNVWKVLETFDKTDSFSKVSLNVTFEYAVSSSNASLILKCLTVAREKDRNFASGLAKKALHLLSGSDRIIAEALVIADGSTEETEKTEKWKNDNRSS